MGSGIYIISSPSDNYYVGSAVNINHRWSKHKYDLKFNKHHSRALQAAFNKYNGDLIFKILFYCPKELLIFYEQRAIDTLKPKYNMSPRAGNSLGIKRSVETISRMKLAKSSLNSRQNISNKLKGIVRSQESRAKMSISQIVYWSNMENRLSNSSQQKFIKGNAESRLENSRLQKIAQNKPEVIAKKAGRLVLCVETGQVFPSGHHAAEWCIIQKLTTNKNAFVWINRAVRDSILAYGYNWKAVQLNKEVNHDN